MADAPRTFNRSAGMGEADYRSGASDRLAEAYILLRAGSFGGSIYLAGRGAEGALRAVLWKADPEIRLGKKSLETNHDLPRLLAALRDLGVIKPGKANIRLAANVQHVARLWYNNMRFASSRSVETRWRKIGEVTGQRTFKQAASEFYEACLSITKRCETLCHSPPPKKP